MLSEIEGRAVYLSGPMTGREDWNRAAFAEAERACRDVGACHVFNPAKDAPKGQTSIPTPIGCADAPTS